MMKSFPLIATIAVATLTLAACGSVPGQQEPQGVVTTQIKGVGTEPFWGFQFSGNVLQWSQPGETGIENTTYTNFNQTSATGAILYTNGAIDITADFASCSDGMSENVYPLTVTVTKDGETLNGCGMM